MMDKLEALHEIASNLQALITHTIPTDTYDIFIADVETIKQKIKDKL